MPEVASAQHRHRGVAAVQRMVEHAPSSGGLALWVHHRDVSEDGAGTGLPVHTDGIAIVYAPAFDRLPLEEQTGWVAHELLHIALRHVQRLAALQARLGDVDVRLFNLCADAIVNSSLSHLRWLRLPAGALLLDDLLDKVLEAKHSPDTALLEWDVERLYLAVDDRRAQPAQRGQRSPQRAGVAAASASGSASNTAAGPSQAQGTPVAGEQGADDGPFGPRQDGPRASRLRALGAREPRDLQPQPGSPEAPESEAEEARSWSERIVRGHAGDGRHSMLRALLADLPRVHTPWEQLLRTHLARGLSMKPAPSWSRPTRSYIANQGRTVGGRRLPWEPGTSPTRTVPRLALVVDVSGSIDDGLLARFGREVEAIARRLEAALVLVVGDLVVRQVQWFEAGRADLGALKLHGGGGTDFRPLLAEALQHRPDLIVVLTDLDGPAGDAPACPVLWAVCQAHAPAAAPFGRLLVLR